MTVFHGHVAIGVGHVARHGHHHVIEEQRMRVLGLGDGRQDRRQQLTCDGVVDADRARIAKLVERRRASLRGDFVDGRAGR